MKVVVFDLDDTLYDELTFVSSGFLEVAKQLSKEYSLNEFDIFKKMWRVFEQEGRGLVFDTILKDIGVWNKKNVRRCVSIYRIHKPKLELYNDAKQVISYLTDCGIPQYIVTDGNKLVQYNKIKSLQLDTMMKRYFITHRFGVKHAKPSPYCFEKICELERVESRDVLYVGDNISKDFVGIKPLGYQTAQILRGSYMNLDRPNSYQAHLRINSLTDIIEQYF